MPILLGYMVANTIFCCVEYVRIQLFTGQVQCALVDIRLISLRCSPVSLWQVTVCIRPMPTQDESKHDISLPWNGGMLLKTYRLPNYGKRGRTCHIQGFEERVDQTLDMSIFSLL